MVCFFVPLLVLPSSRRNGTENGIFSYGVATYTALIIIVNIKVRLSPPRHLSDEAIKSAYSSSLRLCVSESVGALPLHVCFIC